MRRILSRNLFSVVGAIVTVVMARDISSSTVREIKAHESWQWCDPMDE